MSAQTFTFYAANGQYLNWTITDQNTGLPIDNSSVTSTLYAGRDINNPTGTPGTPVASFTNIPLKYVTGTNGQYQGVIPASFNPPLGSNYVLVVDAVTPGYQNQHWENPAVVVAGSVAVSTPALLTPAQLRTDYPEFADSAKYPDASINYWVKVATCVLNQSRWGCTLTLGVELYVAHNLVLEKQAQDTAKAQGWPGLSKGVISSESAGAVSVNYDTAPAVEENAGHWNLTTYGTRFIKLARMMGAGPIYVGGGFGAPGTVPGASAGSDAWPGPLPFPWS